MQLVNGEKKIDSNRPETNQKQFNFPHSDSFSIFPQQNTDLHEIVFRILFVFLSGIFFSLFLVVVRHSLLVGVPKLILCNLCTAKKEREKNRFR